MPLAAVICRCHSRIVIVVRLKNQCTGPVHWETLEPRACYRMSMDPWLSIIPHGNKTWSKASVNPFREPVDRTHNPHGTSNHFELLTHAPMNPTAYHRIFAKMKKKIDTWATIWLNFNHQLIFPSSTLSSLASIVDVWPCVYVWVGR